MTGYRYHTMIMYELLSVGLVILLGLLGGKLAHRVKIPRVTGYMLTGLVMGPSLVGLLSSGTLQDIHLINDIALGLILFAIGGEVEFSHLKSMGMKVIWIALSESIGAFFLVFLVSWWLTRDGSLAMVLGAISMATAPGVTLLVIREYVTRGPLTDTLLAVVALNNVICLVSFAVFFNVFQYLEGIQLSEVLWNFIKGTGGSILIGGTVGAMITYWEQKIDDLSELLLVIIAGLLLGIGLAKELGISHLFVCLIIGAVTNNLSMMHRLVYAELRQTEMPFYVAFFVLSGASLHIGSLQHLGILGIGYLIARPVGKILGSYWAGRKFGAEPQVTQNLGIALFPQAGVAIGMAITVNEIYPDYGQVVSTVILSSVIVYEGFGPFLTKLALGRAKEIYLQE